MWITRRLALLAAVLVLLPLAAEAQELTRLYAPRPPAGSAYVRIVDLSGSGAPLRFGGAAAPVAPDEVAAIYRVVKGDAPLEISRGGKPVPGAPAPAADSFSTIVIASDGAARLIADGTDARNDLKAQLRVYNLVPGCAGAVAVVDGPTVFDGLATDETRVRAINPIEASLVGRCGDKTSVAFKLPPLKAGDHFSLFLMEGPSGPVLNGQRDETEPYRGSAN